MVYVISVASSDGVIVYCPEGGKFSFFNSPYPAHSTYSAIDIYPRTNFGQIAPSPIYGEVTSIRRVRCPDSRGFKGSKCDYVILLRSLENAERLIKILHVEPIVEVGEIIKPGDEIGFLLRSGFFDFWTEPHLHVEVRDPLDPIRARGGFKLERSIHFNALAENIDLHGIVVESKQEYSLINLEHDLRYGIPVEVNGEYGILDAGVPHYRLLGVHMSTQPSIGSIVKLNGVKAGVVESVHSNMCIAKCFSNLTFKVKGHPVGLSLYLYTSKPLLKIIPNKIGALKLEESEDVSIMIS
ncbi:MAG: hypothetical protein QXR45_00150 [Candidatus Bathyarchaeia archaeon]